MVIIDFEKAKRKVSSPAGGQEQRGEQIAQYGKKADEALERWKRWIPLEDRKVLAANFRWILEENSLKPRDFFWHDVGASSPNSFRMQLSRMKNENSKHIPASSGAWRRYIGFVNSTLRRLGKPVSKNLMMHYLTRGTRFHPTVQDIDKQEKKLVAGFYKYAEQIDKKYGLLQTYKKLAALAATNNSNVNRLGIGEYQIRVPFGEDWNLAKAFDEKVLRQKGLHGRSYMQCTVAELEGLCHIMDKWDLDIDEEPDLELEGLRNELKSYLWCIDSERILFWEDADSRPSISWASDFQYIPRSLLGMDLTFSVAEGESIDTLLSDYVDEKGVIESWEMELSYGGYIYLALYPDAEMKRIVPYVANYDFGCSWRTLEQAVRSSGDEVLIPANHTRSAPSVMSGLTELLIKNVSQIKKSMASSATLLLQHPLFVNEKKKDKELEEAIDAIWSDEDF